MIVTQTPYDQMDDDMRELLDIWAKQGSDLGIKYENIQEPSPFDGAVIVKMEDGSLAAGRYDYQTKVLTLLGKKPAVLIRFSNFSTYLKTV